MIEPNWTSLIPALVAIATAILSRRPVESLLAGVAAGLLLGPGSALIAAVLAGAGLTILAWT
jgi:hypothetical protein